MEEKAGQTLIDTTAAEGQRVDGYLCSQINDLSRSQIQKLIRDGGVMINGKVAKAAMRVQSHDQLHVTSQQVHRFSLNPGIKPTEVPFEVLYEDEHLLVINKPRGLVVHPGAGTNDQATLVHGLLHHLGIENPTQLPAAAGEGSELRPGIVHRLDKDTTGVMVCAKTSVALHKLAQQFAEKTNQRVYSAVLVGQLEEHHQGMQRVDLPIGRDQRDRKRYSVAESSDAQPLTEVPAGYKNAASWFMARRLYTAGKCTFTLADVVLETGRTHQIRVHAEAIGCPVWGDPVYHRHLATSTLPFESPPFQMLHARILGFTHPVTGKKMAFEADLPEDFCYYVELLGTPCN